jgi:two-component system chemotaxis response regulator CheB
MAESTTAQRGHETATKTRRAYDVVVIAASTGGPGALETVLGGLGADFELPILVVQHMMPAFTAEFSTWLGRSISLPVDIARHGQKLEPGHVYVAPEDVHLKLVDSKTVGLSNEPKCGYHRPSADVLFGSAAEYFGARTLAVVLTGMGSDGTNGLRKIRAAGGRILVQDEDSCVVYGMPGSAVAAGLADSIVALGDMAVRVRVLARLQEEDRDQRPSKEFSDPS